MTWVCHVCKDERPDRFISVFTSNVTPAGPDGTPVSWEVRQNVRYCNDRAACIDGAKDVRFFA